MPKLLITELFSQINSEDDLLQWGRDYLEIKKQQKEKVLLPLQQQTEILMLLDQKIEMLNSGYQQMNQPHDHIPLQNYLSEYSIHLKQHFYG